MWISEERALQVMGTAGAKALRRIRYDILRAEQSPTCRSGASQVGRGVISDKVRCQKPVPTGPPRPRQRVWVLS